jgi:hypothetical protein
MRLVERTGGEIQAGLCDPKTVRSYMETIKRGVKPAVASKTALIIYTKILKLAQEQRHVMVEVLHSFGLSSTDELERMVRQHKDAKAVTPEQRAAICEDYLEIFYNANPSRRAAGVRKLGGEVPVDSDSYAVVVVEGGVK